uniref:Uncharacterized protein n=1 Tax=Ditylenchus dipsaci TaxID=166011 RepID=A0A915CR92_9BILA
MTVASQEKAVNMEDIITTSGSAINENNGYEISNDFKKSPCSSIDASKVRCREQNIEQKSLQVSNNEVKSECIVDKVDKPNPKFLDHKAALDHVKKNLVKGKDTFAFLHNYSCDPELKNAFSTLMEVMDGLGEGLSFIADNTQQKNDFQNTGSVDCFLVKEK